MPKHSSMKRRARPNKFVPKTLTTKQTQPACGSQMGGAHPKTAYVMLVPADDKHNAGSEIKIPGGKTGTIIELMDVSGLNEFANDNKLTAARPNKESEKTKVVLGKVSNEVKAYINGKVVAINSAAGSEVKYENEIELYNPSSTPSTANSDNGTASAILFAQEPTEPELATESADAVESAAAAAAVEEPPVVEEEPYINANEFTNAEIGSEKNTKFTVFKTKKAVKLSKDMSELGYLGTKQIKEITSLNDYKNIYNKFTAQKAPNCVFLVYKLKLDANKPEQYYVFNKFSKPLLLTNAANPVELTTDTCNTNHLLSPEPNEVLKDGFIVESFYNTLKGGKRMTLRKHKKFVAKSATKTLKRQ